jgi:hypothetical protein
MNSGFEFLNSTYTQNNYLRDVESYIIHIGAVVEVVLPVHSNIIVTRDAVP